jgi:hypothetical protein
MLLNFGRLVHLNLVHVLVVINIVAIMVAHLELWPADVLILLGAIASLVECIQVLTNLTRIRVVIL